MKGVYRISFLNSNIFLKFIFLEPSSKLSKGSNIHQFKLISFMRHKSQIRIFSKLSFFFTLFFMRYHQGISPLAKNLTDGGFSVVYEKNMPFTFNSVVYVGDWKGQDPQKIWFDQIVGKNLCYFCSWIPASTLFLHAHKVWIKNQFSLSLPIFLNFLG